MSEEGFHAVMEWARAAKIHQKHLSNLAYIEDIKTKDISYWGQQATDRFFARITTKSLAEQANPWASMYNETEITQMKEKIAEIKARDELDNEDNDES
ncbi:hypothetical protein N7493_003172 [Penicillium malachiteum]|uniref:Uncharacterized protein n=1 Tax=Penicillium malachiteum TaxID=1324776 RepID=A0AAD6HT92_9EURO|nr:hypothetical protein N7493_003172 [Penicillium malachiteum]